MSSLFLEDVNWKWFEEKGWVLTRTKQGKIWEFEKGVSEIRVQSTSSSTDFQLFHQSKLIIMLTISLGHLTLASETIKTIVKNFSR